jgi:hypothetical protein
LLHVVEVPSKADVSTGMRVVAKWADDTQGGMGDIASFVPEDSQ